MTALRATINQQVQIGLEATPGTAVATNKLIEAFEWTLGVKPETKQFRATGRRHNAASEELTEMSQGKVKGIACYNSTAYILAALYGMPTIAAHGASAIAYDAVWTPLIQGAQTPKTLTIGQGDANYAEQYPFGVVTGFGYEVSRKAEVPLTADLIMGLEADVALTAAPTPIPVVPMVGKHFNLYLDATSAGIGTTQLLNPVKFGPSYSGYYGPFWPVNRANPSYANLVDTAPKCEFKLLMEADTQGKSLKSYLQNGTRCYVRVGAVGPVLDGPNSINYGLIHDFCFFVTAVADFSDSDGVYAIEWTLELAEDTAWGTGEAQKITLTNSLSAL